MDKKATILILGLAITSCLAAGYAKFAWIAYDPAPAMGHTFLPATQDVVFGQSTFTLTATVTDKDTFQDSNNPQSFSQLSGNENDVTIETNFTPQATNTGFDSSTGVRTRTYIFATLNDMCQNPGRIAYYEYKTRGVDQMSYLWYDVSPTNWSTCVVALKYIPLSDPGG